MTFWRAVKQRYDIKSKQGVLPLFKRRLKEEWWQPLYPSMSIIFDDLITELKLESLVEWKNLMSVY